MTSLYKLSSPHAKQINYPSEEISGILCEIIILPIHLMIGKSSIHKKKNIKF